MTFTNGQKVLIHHVGDIEEKKKYCVTIEYWRSWNKIFARWLSD